MKQLDALRADFPLLKQTVKGKPLVYFDNSCMSLRPWPVIKTMERYYTDMSACAGRSNHRLARAVTEATEEARKKVAKFIGAKESHEIVFTRNTSEGLNLVAHSLGLKAGDVVVTSDKEHNSNLVPWLKLTKTLGIKHVIVKSREDNTFDMDAFEKVLESIRVKLVSMVQTSNLDGVTFPIAEITQKAHEAGALMMVDGAQSVPHTKIDVKRLGVDFLAFSGHKMCGPSGMGVLYGKRELLEAMEGFMVGGDTVEYTTYTDYKHLPVPEKFEAGLQDYAGMMGMGAAVEYLEQVGMDNIHKQEVRLNTLISEGLSDEPRIRLIGPEDPAKRAGIFSFAVTGVDPHQISLLLDESYGIMVRSGQHCVHSWCHEHKMPGTVRASVYFYNTEEEALRFVDAVKQILAIV
jgi:cysteine desulfurase / selenocysteine lyase